jgi:hypothetical protein
MQGDVKQTTTGFQGPLMVQSLTSAKSNSYPSPVEYDHYADFMQEI